ncbi:MAG: class I tRNA ligase family protein, partial [Pyrinomonadaceae bacterium]
LEGREELQFPADVYLEGGDQYRGWFNSSLMIALAAHDRAPYKTVLTHGWVVDGEGKAMHKSAGNAVSPNDVIKESGAEILRLWVASTDYHEDMRCSPEILQRVGEAYRKMRNTVRFALGNLDGFDPARDSLPIANKLEIDRWALSELNAVVDRVSEAYERYEFHVVYQTLYNFCTGTLSSRYFDIIKDRLYTAAPRSRERRSAQIALYFIADALARLLAQVLVFTADEIWEQMPLSEGQLAHGRNPASVHLAEFPHVTEEAADEELRARWARLFEIRDEVLPVLEEARAEKLIGSSLEARVRLQAHGDTLALLERYKDDLRYLFIVSEVTLEETARDELSVVVERAAGQKCERCWNYSTRVGEFARYPTACERCAPVLEEIEREAA